jgi:hypothetical protein
MTMLRPCQHCPWRAVNHGKRTPWGFYTRRNLTRLWNQIRRGGQPQGCHPTDPSHPDHIAAGAKLGSKTQECAGSVILVMREAQQIASYGTGGRTVDPAAVDAYFHRHRDGLTKSGVLYWVVGRIAFAGVPFVGERPLPEVDVDEPGIAR